LYVLDHCKGIEFAYQNGKAGETYNIGGKNEYNNLYIATKICAILDEILPQKASYKKQITFVEDRLGHDFRYAIDASKIENELNWKSDESFDEGVKKTIKWYLKKYKQ
jgi:dTDP-glucose 4,6-dehydratase